MLPFRLSQYELKYALIPKIGMNFRIIIPKITLNFGIRDFFVIFAVEYSYINSIFFILRIGNKIIMII
ncbi:MAG: hypothetical protein EGS41_08380 [Prevotella sp.]|nr:hypothetical protein [Prevotella sp.]